ncbi:MAG: cysteine hydrolase family protein [Candidatus Binataceae bacterium]
MSGANPAMPHAGTIALLVLDLQVDFLDRNGRMPIAQDQIGPVLANSNRVIEAATPHRIVIAYVGNEYTRWDLPGNWFRHNAARAGTPGAALDSRLKRVATAPYFPKRQGDAFSNPELGRFLRAHHITHVVICGVYADACITATAREALRRGFTVTVLADAVGAASDSARQSALAKLSRAGAEVQATSGFINHPGAAVARDAN